MATSVHLYILFWTLAVGPITNTQHKTIDSNLDRSRATNAALWHNSHGLSLSLSPDQKMAALLRPGSDGLLELVVRSVSSPERTIVRVGGRLPVGSFKLPIKGDLQWSESGNKVFYLLEFIGTSNYLACLDVRSGEVKPLADVITFSVIRSGEYKGYLVALKRKHTLVRVWDWYWLLNDAGSELGPIGGEDDLKEFLDRYVKQ
jgi:hypothetical protein